MPQPYSALVGDWTKITNSACSRKYPAAIQFQENGRYFARNDPGAGFLIWDIGTYALAGAGELAISLANDAVATYPYTVAGEVLSFTDADGCTFEYRRTS
jgi:hypothetical protein